MLVLFWPALKNPGGLPFIIDVVPPPEPILKLESFLKLLFQANKCKPKSCKYATTNVLDGPKVEGEEEDDEDEAANEAIREPPT